MTRTLIIGIAAAAVGTVASMVATPAGAQEGPLLPMQVSPTGGPAGTVIEVSGENCDLEDPVVHIELVDVDTGEAVDSVDASPDEAGSWADELTVPEGVDPNHDYVVEAACAPFPGATPDVRYESVEFDVTGDTTATTVPPPPTTEPAPAEPPGVDTASPVEAEPTFTG